jgi:Ca2+-dependent lipid-binding protein
MLAACVRLYIRAHRRLQSTIQSNSRHPVWNECFRLLVHDPSEDTLTCLVYDYDFIRADTLVGRRASKLPNMTHLFTCISKLQLCK